MTDESVSELETKIKEKFKLFQGLRSDDEDQKLLDQILDMCFEELISFMAKNLSEAEQKNFLNELEQKSTDDEKVQFIQESLTKVDNYQKKYSGLIENFLDELLYESMSDKSN